MRWVDCQLKQTGLKWILRQDESVWVKECLTCIDEQNVYSKKAMSISLFNVKCLNHKESDLLFVCAKWGYVFCYEMQCNFKRCADTQSTEVKTKYSHCKYHWWQLILRLLTPQCEWNEQNVQFCYDLWLSKLFWEWFLFITEILWRLCVVFVVLFELAD